MIQSVEQLCTFLELDTKQLDLDATPDFALKVPQHFANQIEKGNPNDPLLRQILPGLVEKQPFEGFISDPVGDLLSNRSPSLIHKYRGRALLVTSPRCDIHCRYCFRRHFPYEQSKKRHLDEALETLANDKSVEEVILSGGDPLTLAEGRLVDLVQQIESIPHITTLRMHSRTPIVAPDRAQYSKLLQVFSASRLQIVLVTHCNHANELSDATADCLTQFHQADVTLLNQSVLLKEINDDADTLADLSKKLFQQGVLPYYCHLLDKVAGAGHFEVEKHQAWLIFEALRRQLPGYLVPKFVEEIAGEPYKTLFERPELTPR